MCLCLSWASNWLISDLFHVSLVTTRPPKHTALRGLGKPRSSAGSASLLRRSGSAVRCWLEWTVRDEAGVLPSFSLTNETTDSLSVTSICLKGGKVFVLFLVVFAVYPHQSIIIQLVEVETLPIFFFLKRPCFLLASSLIAYLFGVSLYPEIRGKGSLILFPEVSSVKTQCFIR